MRYSEELIEEVRARNDIVDVIGEHVRLKRSGSRYFGLCPFHNEKTGSFSVDPANQLYYCFGCHAAGNVYTFEMQYLNSSFAEALETLADRAGIALPKEHFSKERKEEEDRKAILLDIHRKAAGFYYYQLRTKTGANGLAYLKKRGLDDETIKRFGLGYAGKFSSALFEYLKGKGFSEQHLSASGLFLYDEKTGFRDRFFNRVMFPICDVRGRVIGFGGRVMGDGKPKYLNSPESELFNKRLNLFGLQAARAHGRENIILCEGYMDAISMHQAGIENAVASLGTALTSQQARLLSRYTKTVLLMYDSDDAGVNAAVRAVPILMEAGLGTKVVSLKPYKDPDEFVVHEGTEELKKRIDASENGFLFTIAILAAGYDFSDPQAKTDFEREAASRLMVFSDELERNNYVEAVASRYHIPLQSLKRHMARLAAAGQTKQVTEERAREDKVSAHAAQDGGIRAERLMLSYLAAYPDAYKVSAPYVAADDFTDPFLKQIAGLLYEQLGTGEISLSAIVGHFTELEEEQKAAAIFHEEIEVKDQAALDRAFTDTVFRIRRQSNKARMDAWNGDMKELTALMQEKALIDEEEQAGLLLHIAYKERDEGKKES